MPSHLDSDPQITGSSTENCLFINDFTRNSVVIHPFLYFLLLISCAFVAFILLIWYYVQSFQHRFLLYRAHSVLSASPILSLRCSSMEQLRFLEFSGEKSTNLLNWKNPWKKSQNTFFHVFVAFNLCAFYFAGILDTAQRLSSFNGQLNHL